MVHCPSPESATLPLNPASSGSPASAEAVRSSSQEETTLPRRQTSATSVRLMSKRSASTSRSEDLPLRMSKPSA